jgi:hypothetical protein
MLVRSLCCTEDWCPLYAGVHFLKATRFFIIFFLRQSLAMLSRLILNLLCGPSWTLNLWSSYLGLQRWDYKCVLPHQAVQKGFLRFKICLAFNLPIPFLCSHMIPMHIKNYVKECSLAGGGGICLYSGD